MKKEEKKLDSLKPLFINTESLEERVKESLAQTCRGEVKPYEEVMIKLGKKHGF